MQWKTVCFQCLQEVYNYHDPANNILFKEELCSRRLAQRVLMWWFFRKLCPFYWIILCVQFVPFAMCSIVEICQMYYVDCRHRNFIFKLVDIESTLCFYQISLWIVPTSSCLYLQCRGNCNVGQDRVKIVSTLQPLYPVYIVDIVDIAMVTYIDFTSYLHCLYYILFKLTT